MVEHPCAGGLSGACFKAYPAWARQAFAYKLLHILLPKQLSKDLPRGLNLALVPPGVILPPGVVLPPGTIVPPDVTFPPGWTPGDPAPPGVVIPPGTTFPPGWTPGDPAPPDVVIPPGTVFPPGWTPGDPPPPGVQLPPSVSPVPPDSGALPPLYVQPFEPGPIHRPTEMGEEEMKTGSILAYGGPSAPEGYLLCNGAAVSRTTYSALFAIIGTAFGSGDGSSTFNIPDLRQRIPIGKAVSGTGSILGSSFGSIDHTHYGYEHRHYIEAGADLASGLDYSNITSLQQEEVYVGENPPCQVVNYIIKT